MNYSRFLKLWRACARESMADLLGSASATQAAGRAEMPFMTTFLDRRQPKKRIERDVGAIKRAKFGLANPPSPRARVSKNRTRRSRVGWRPFRNLFAVRACFFDQ